MGRTLLGFCLGVALITSQASASYASPVPTNIDGTEVALSARLYQGTTYVSLRALVEQLSPESTVYWAEGQAVVEGDGFTLTACGGDDFLTYQAEEIPVEHGIYIEEGVTLVPVRILTSMLGGAVDWNPDCGTVDITSAPEITWSEEDFYWLSRIISAESRGEPTLGQIAVGNVVVNRVASGIFPNTIYDVIFDARWGGQFEPVANGTIYEEPTVGATLAAYRVLTGENVAKESLYFLAPDLTTNHWAIENCAYVTTIGCHWFYR